MQLSLEGIERALPHYLSAPRREGVKKALADFPNIRFFYLKAYPQEPLQGDCWNGLTVFNFEDGTRKKIRGMLLSNSCDMDDNNRSAMPHRVTFCPVFTLRALAERWAKQGIDEAQIADTIGAIKRQEVSSFIYLPAGASLDEESVAYLADVHTIPYAAFAAESSKAKLATLTDPSFYLFVFKLSYHFCRLHEDVDRSQAAEEA